MPPVAVTAMVPRACGSPVASSVSQQPCQPAPAPKVLIYLKHRPVRQGSLAGFVERLAMRIEYPNWQERTAEIGRAMIEETLEIDLHDALPPSSFLRYF